jgi:hypothetical protein
VLGEDIRVEHEDPATSHGRSVGANMAGAAEAYEHLPFFYSDLFDVGYEAVGACDSRLPMLVELGKVDDARELIRAGEPITAGALDVLEAKRVS